MKKMQSLGKSLSKNEQKNVIGGMMRPVQVECICDDLSHHWSNCSDTCLNAGLTCNTVCIPYGNSEPVALQFTCKDCG